MRSPATRASVSASVDVSCGIPFRAGRAFHKGSVGSGMTVSDHSELRRGRLYASTAVAMTTVAMTTPHSQILVSIPMSEAG